MARDTRDLSGKWMTAPLAFGLSAGTLLIFAPFAATQSFGSGRALAMLVTAGVFFLWGVVLVVLGRGRDR